MPAWQAVLDEGEAVYRGFVPAGLHPGAEGYQRFVTPVILQAVGHVAMAGPTLIVDNPGAVVGGAWTNSAATPGYFGSDYLHDGNAGKGTKSVTFTPQIPTAGNYPVYLRWTADTNRAGNVPVTITHAGGSTGVAVNQRLNNGNWVLLGVFDFAAGNGGNIRIDNTGTDGFVVADAVGIGLPGGLPAVMLRGDNGRAAEPHSASSAGRNTRVILARSGATTAPLSVNLSITGGAGAADYGTFPASIIIPAGASSAFLTLTPLSDGLAEGEESFRVAIVPDPENHTLATPVKASVVIEDRPSDGWRFGQFTASQLADPLVSGDLADPDGDGLENLLEFFTGRRPQLADGQDAARGGSEMVVEELYQTLTYDRVAASGLAGSVEISTDLLDWQSGVSLLEESVLADDGLSQVIRVRSRAPLGSGQAEFLRLKVVREP